MVAYTPVAKPKTERELAEFIGSFYDDPYGFVMAVYPWGRQQAWDGGFNDLAEETGPEEWQERYLKQLGEHIKMNRDWTLMDPSCDPFVWRSARASGHGVGKSALVAWLIQFFMATRADTRGAVTANTQNQLETRTWPELAKWHKKLICNHWFQWTATSYYFKAYPEEQRKNYMVTASTVSAENSEAFQGLHNKGKTIFIVFDEASGIEQPVYDVADGALTDGEAFLCMFGNPTRPDGPFYDCFDKYKSLYNLEHVDSRSVRHTNKNALNDIIAKHGPDSDQARIRVYGQFPTQAFNGFISLDAVDEAIDRPLTPDNQAALIMAVDPARYGDDESVIYFRQGRDARSRKCIPFRGLNSTFLADRVNEVFLRERPDALVVEDIGVGNGVVDRLRDVYKLRVVSVFPGSKSADPRVYNKRVELWQKMKDWIYEHGCLSEDRENSGLKAQLTQIQYSIHRVTGQTMLEDKQMFKSRFGRSPDHADALALTFAVKLAGRDTSNTRYARLDRQEAITDYDVMGY